MEFYSAVIAISSAALSSSVALLLPSLGEGISERAGVLNIGTEGYMISGALAGYYGCLYTGHIWAGFLLGMLIGFLLSLIHAFLCVTLKTNQIVSGTGIWLLCTGLSAYVFRLVGQTSVVDKLKPVYFPILSDLPIIGPVFFRHNLMVYISLLLVPVCAFILYRTPWGLLNKAVGDSPLATDMAGHNVSVIRYVSVGICGALAGLGGGYLAIGALSRFSEGLTAGKGFIAIAIVIFGRWDPIKILGGAIFFSLIDSIQLYLQAKGSIIPYPVLIIMPYLMTLIVLCATSRKAKDIPRRLGVPYFRGEE